MIDLKAITKHENILKPQAEEVRNANCFVYYGLGFDLIFNWCRFEEWFGKPLAIIDRNSAEGQMYQGIPILRSLSLISKDKLAQCFCLITAPSYRQEIYKEASHYIDEERIMKYPDLLTRDSPCYGDFIKKHEAEIMELYDSLCDDRSKEVLEEWLTGKVSGDMSHFVKAVTPNEYVNVHEFPMEMLRNAGYNSEMYYRRERSRRFPNTALFTTGIWENREDEVYFDCGTAHGDTYSGFVKAYNNRFRRIVCFEMDKGVYEDLKFFVADEKRTICMHCGVSDKDSMMLMNTGFIGGTSIDAGKQTTGNDEMEHVESVSLRSIDSVAEELGIRPSLIKMDIEGAEMLALQGAEYIIRTCKPKLMVCLYHKDEDLITIPKYIKTLSPDYRFYVRLYDVTSSELVLYCR